MCFYPSTRAKVLCRRNPFPEVPPGRFFVKFTSTFHVHTGEPKVKPKTTQSTQNAQKRTRSLLWGVESVMFTCGIGESSPLLKHKQGLCFHHIMKVRAPPFLLRNSLRERTAHREHFFSHFWLSFWRPSATQGRPRETKSAQKDSQSLPGDT